ncbi:MAG TPA: acetolactate synthase large subunit, partial [Hellea balneolensis]|nr:acetolactate synthase large subunit [Hellea balneolensis]
MNGAEALIQSLSESGVDVCFANPGTSEMQLVAAIDGQKNMRAVLGLFEGVVTGAADGYGRMADKPALTLLHVGAGLANGCANLHNAKRAYSPVLNMVGDHASYHLQYDAPLTSDVAGVARPFSDWLATSKSSDDLVKVGTDALRAALQFPGQVATFIAPADHAWDEANLTLNTEPPEAPRTSQSKVEAAINALGHDGPTAILLGARALREDALAMAGRIADGTGAKLISETFSTRLQRGAGRVAPERIPYFGELAADFLKNFEQVIIVGTTPPVSFFAYPDKPSWLLPDGVEPVILATPHECPLDALSRTIDGLKEKGVDIADRPKNVQASMIPPVDDGPLHPVAVGGVLAELMPDNAIISDGAATAGLAIFPMTAGTKHHDWMMLTGGAIGQGLPVGIGAAIACPDRKVICLEADGSAMYTIQSLWTMARENLDITTVIINNGSYA